MCCGGSESLFVHGRGPEYEYEQCGGCEYDGVVELHSDGDGECACNNFDDRESLGSAGGV